MEEVKRKYGALESPKDLRDFRVSSTITNVTLPEEFNLTSTSIKNQGMVNSCVAHALSSMLEKKYKDVFSTGWIYGFRPEGYYQGEGMYPREALKTLQKQGAVKQQDFPYNIEMIEAKTKVDDNITLLEAQAEDYKISAYARLYSENEIKSWLYTKEIPIPISIATDNLQLDNNNIIKIPKVYPNSGHEMMIIGWNKTGYIIQNSWGEDWGDKGTAILPYEYTIREAWGVTLDTTLKSKDTDVKKPSFSLIRALIMFLLSILNNKGGK